MLLKYLKKFINVGFISLYFSYNFPAHIYINNMCKFILLRMVINPYDIHVLSSRWYSTC